ncbi:MAG: hypothetical protein ACI9JN_002267 [Bacteroidia bacterium]|jgi:hypothetical protein
MRQAGFMFKVYLVVAAMCVGLSGTSQTLDSNIAISTDTQSKVQESNNLSPQLDYLDVVPPLVEARKVGAYPWIFIIAVCILLLIGLIRALALPQHKLSLVIAFSNINNQYEQIDKEATINSILMLQAFVSAVIVALGLFVTKPFRLNTAMQHDFRFFLLLVLAVLLVYTVKYFIHYLVGIVLQSENLAKLMVVGLSGMLYAFTLLIFPLIVAWYYVPVESIKGGIGILLLLLCAVFVVWRLVKSGMIYYRYFPFAKIYIIIYLCALEITPLLIIGKLIDVGVH